MPIKSSYVLISRLTVVYILAFVYSATVWLPTIILPILYIGFNLTQFVLSFILIFIIPIFVTILSALFGYFIAIITSRIQKKSIITTIVSLAFLGIYYYCISQFSSFIENIIQNKETIALSVRSWGYYLYLLGNGVCGNILQYALFILINAILFIVCIYALSFSYFRIISKNTGVSFNSSKVKFSKQNNINITLLKKEFSRFISSSTYTLNCGLGLVFVVATPIMALIKRDDVLSFINIFEKEAPFIVSLLPIGIVTIISLLISTNVISTPSLSLEGKTLWVLKTLPVSFMEIYGAKEKLHVLINAIFAIPSLITLSVCLNVDFNLIIYESVILLLIIVLEADVGLIVGLLNPNFAWTSEVTPIKQSINTLISMLISMIISIAIIVIYYLLMNNMTIDSYLSILVFVFMIIIILLRKWLREKGSAIFNKL